MEDEKDDRSSEYGNYSLTLSHIMCLAVSKSNPNITISTIIENIKNLFFIRSLHSRPIFLTVIH